MKKKSFKEFIISCLKGIGIGISMIIPGVSGGAIAILLKIYDQLLDAVTGIFKNFKQSFFTLLPLAIGGGIGFIGLVYPLEYGLSKIPLVIVSLFAGLVIGGIPSIYKKVQGKENVLGIVIGLISLGIMIGLCFLDGVISIDLSVIDFNTWIYLFFSGIVASIGLIAPGISGSMCLMALGTYMPLISAITDVLSFTNLSYNIMFLIPIILGLIIGFVIMIILMKYLLKKHPTPTYFGILGFIIGSIATIYYLTITDGDYPVKFDAFNIIFSIITLVGGFLTTFLLEIVVTKKEEEKDKEENESCGFKG